MSLIYPDNTLRADRLQQLVNDVVSLQTQITNCNNQMDRAEAAMKPLIAKMETAQGIKTFDDLRAKISAALPEAQRTLYNDMIVFNSTIGDVADVITKTSSFILGSASASGIAIDITVYSKTVGLIRIVKAYAYCFKLLVTEGFDVALKAFKGLREGLQIISEGFTEASTFGRVLGTAAEFIEFLGYVGVLVDGIILIMRTIQAAEQKAKLIDAIHKTQVSRLSCSLFNDEATKVVAHVESFVDWVTMAASSDADDQAGARAMGKRIAKTLATPQTAATLADMETLLEQQDKARKYYSADDLPRADVISLATVDIQGSNPKATLPPNGMQAKAKV